MKTKVLVGILIVMVLITGIGIVMAHGDFSEAKRLIDSNISCNELSKGQLDEMGDYYMEQMHPGEAHEMMHKMMGGEDSETTKLMHVNMAKGIYCGENTMMQGNMMGYGMIGGGIMNMMYGNMMGWQNVQGSMMGSLRYGFGYWNVINTLYAILLIGLVILVYLWIVRLLRNMQKKR